MPRGRAKKTAAQVELLPPEENDQPIIREVKHKTEWIESIPVEGMSEDEDDAESVEEVENRPRKKTRNAIQEMRKKLRAQGVTPTSNLRLYIDRYVHSETEAGGSWAETEFCTKYSTTEEHIFNKDYIDAARKWGPGRYRITIRMDNRIVDAFDERISATPVTGPAIQHVNPNDPNSPQAFAQANGDGQQQMYQPMSMKDMMKAQRESLKEELEFRRLLMESYGMAPNQQGAQNGNRSEEEILAGAILKQPEVIENVVGSVIKRFGGKGNNASDDEPSVTSVLMKAVENNQLASSIQAFGNVALAIVDRIFPKWGQNNGQTPTPPPPPQSPTTTAHSAPTQHQSDPHALLGHGVQSVHPERNGDGSAGQPTTPEEQALGLLIEHCRRNIPVKIAFDRLMAYADAVNEEYPQGSIDGYIDMFGTITTDQAFEFVKTLPGGDQLIALPHAHEWTAELQRLIKESQEGNEE